MNIASPDGRDARLAGVRASADKWRRKIAVVMKWKTCPTCGGAGEQEYWEKGEDGKLVKKQRACSTCHGAGSVPDTD